VVLVWIWARPLVAFFAPHDPAVCAVGVRFLRIVTPFALGATFAIILGRAMNGAGETVMPMILTFISLWGLQVPLGLWLPRHWVPATSGIWWAQSAAILLHGVLITLWFLKGRWRRREV